MKNFNFFITAVLMLAYTFGNAQVLGNYDFRSAANWDYKSQVQIPTARTLVQLSSPGQNLFSIKGLYNCKADAYLAIFTITQVGKTQTEADQLVRAKVDAIKAHLKDKGATAELYVDMISFLPIYEYEESKKLFSKSTYNEIPKGFELKKNLHFKYKSAEVLDFLVTICAEQEIYDLVRVDYIIDNIEAKRAELAAKAETILKAKMARYKNLLNQDFEDKDRVLADAYNMYYPIEQYRTYTAYASNTMNVASGGAVQQQKKTTSQFYQPLMAKGYDFVINASVLEPVVQIEYELMMNVYPKPKTEIPKPVVKTEVQKQIYFITPTGQLQQLNL